MTKKELKQSTKKALIKRVLDQKKYVDTLEDGYASLLSENKKIKEELEAVGSISQLMVQINTTLGTMAIVQKNEAMILAGLRDTQESWDEGLS